MPNAPEPAAAARSRRTLDLLAASLDRVPLAVIVADADGRVALVNAQAEAMFGYAREELVGRGLDILVPERFRGAHPGFRQGFLASPRARAMGEGRELYARRRDGTEFPVEIGLNPFEGEDGTLVLSAIVDITERREREESVRRSLEEKELLLAEVHHRVKNNLQVIHSLLDLQAARSADARVRETLRDSQNRVRSMSLIHQTLYQSHDFARVDFDYFLDALAPTLYDSLAGDAPGVTVEVRRSGLALPIATAIPCGLVVNELVTNAFKHGFAGGRAGKVSVGLEPDGPGHARLVVENDGAGIAADVDLEAGQTLGMTLVRLLAQQVRATLEMRRADPVRFSLRVPLEVA